VSRGDGSYQRLAAAVLVAHQRRDDTNCLCGELRLGDSWADHVAAVLHGVGALRRTPPEAPAAHTAAQGAPTNPLQE